MNTICDYWPIFRQLDPKLLHRIRSFIVLDEEGENILLITSPKSVESNTFGLGRNVPYVGTTVYGFGSNSYGMLGVGHDLPVLEPTELIEFRNRELIQLVHGDRHCLALTRDGEIFAWGQNNLGQLGTTTSYYLLQSLRPKLIGSFGGKNFCQIKSGRNHCLALTKFGRVYSWGNNFDCPITSKISSAFRPNKIKCLKNDFIVQVECGDWHSLALTDDGRLFIWSNDPNNFNYGNYQGEISPKLSPIKLNLPDVRFRAISAGDSHSLVLTDTGSILAFGMNQHGQLGQLADDENEDWEQKPINWIVPEYQEDDTTGSNTIITNVRFGSVLAHHNLSIALSKESGNCFVWGLLNNNNNQNLGNCSKVPCPTLFNNLDLTMAAYSVSRDTPHLIDLGSMFRMEEDSFGEFHHDQTFQINNNQNPVMTRLNRLFNDPTGSDIQFEIESHLVYCHRGYLRLSSEYMDTMLSKRWIQSDVVVIEDYPFSVYYQYLRYLYTGTLDSLDPTVVVDDNIEELVEQLLNLSKCFLEHSLMSECVNRLMDQIKVENCCHMFALSRRLELFQLEQCVVRFVGAIGMARVCRSDGFMVMEGELCKMLMNQVGNLVGGQLD